jgi:hypothetical protein
MLFLFQRTSHKMRTMAITEKYENLQPFWPRGVAVVCSVDIGAVELLTITV